MSELGTPDYSAQPKLQPWFAEMCQQICFLRPEGAIHASPGHRPGTQSHEKNQALKGRPNRCPNPSPAFTFTSFSARRTANAPSPMPSVRHCTLTWPQSCKISAAPRFLSIPSKTMPTCSSISPARSPSAKSLKTSKNPPPNGSKPGGRSSPDLPGRLDTVRLPFQNPTWNPSAPTSPTNANTTAGRRFKRNTAHFLSGTMSHSMSDTSGIERIGPGLQPSMFFHAGFPGRCPGLAWAGALPRGGTLRGLRAGALPIRSANGAAHRQPGAPPRKTNPTPNANGVAHRQPGAPPRETGPIMNANGAAHRQPGASPRETGPTMNANGVAHRQPGAPPQETGPIMNANGAAPRQPGASPRETGAIMNANGVAHRQPGASPRETNPTMNANGVAHRQPGATPREQCTSPRVGLKARPNRHHGREIRPGLQPSMFFDPDSQGVALGWRRVGALPLRRALV